MALVGFDAAWVREVRQCTSDHGGLLRLLRVVAAEFSACGAQGGYSLVDHVVLLPEGQRRV